MDLRELKELWRAIRKLQKFAISVEILISQLVELPPKEQVPKESTLKLLTLSFAKGPRAAEDLVQSLLLPTNTLKMHETNPRLYRHEAFQSLVQV